MGVRKPQPVEKPEALIYYEQCKAMGLPLVVGGLLDQPHIWVREWRIVEDEKMIYEANLKAYLDSIKNTPAGGK